jgi:hypothetical protein
MSMQVNGVTQVASVALPYTGGGNTSGDYEQVSASVTLNAGMNLIRLTAISAPNVSVESFFLRQATTF